jgi:hypothetical protein
MKMRVKVRKGLVVPLLPPPLLLLGPWLRSLPSQELAPALVLHLLASAIRVFLQRACTSCTRTPLWMTAATFWMAFAAMTV